MLHKKYDRNIKDISIEKWTDKVAEIRKRYYEGKFVVGKGPVLEK